MSLDVFLRQDLSGAQSNAGTVVQHRVQVPLVHNKSALHQLPDDGSGAPQYIVTSRYPQSSAIIDRFIVSGRRSLLSWSAGVGLSI